MTTIRFTKLEGLGNDFVLVDQLEAAPQSSEVTPQWCCKVADRFQGVGCDQVLVLQPPSSEARVRGAAIQMVIYNSDGSEAEMCGNGVRAAALYVLKSLGTRTVFETKAGLIETQVMDHKPGWAQVRVNMGEPEVGECKELEVGGKKFQYTSASMGNPHVVIFVDESWTHVETCEWGPQIESHPQFPGRTNVEFVKVTGISSLDVSVWERGAGLTLACGTGACAAAAVALSSGRVAGALDVKLPGGVLRIDWRPDKGLPLWMEGSATEISSGEFPAS